MKRQTLIVLVWILLMVGSTALAEAGERHGFPSREGSSPTEAALQWLGDLADRAAAWLTTRDAAPLAESQRAKGSSHGPMLSAEEPGSSAKPISESSSDDGEGGLPGIGPMPEPGG